MATSVAQSIPIAIPRPPISGNDDRADKTRSPNGLTGSPNKSIIPSSLRASASSLSGVVPRASSFTTSDYHGGSYPQSPRSRAAPANSILLRRSVGSGEESKHTVANVADPGSSSLPPAPVVTHIPAVPVDPAAQRRKERREREKLREKEERERREREIRERELELADAIEEQEEKVWGIPKKAFYFGLGSVPGAINFNAQMAMMAGWGNGSGGQGDYIRSPNDSLTRPPYKSRASSGSTKRLSSSRSISSGTKAGSQKAKPSRAAARKEERAAADREAIEALRSSNSSLNAAYAESDGSDSDVIDAEELAALNAIINTRRSMAAAQALASGEVKLPAPKRPVRPGLAALRGVSMDTVATTPSSTSDVTSLTAPDDAEALEGKCRPSFRRNESTESQLEGAASCKIRFAPLPRPSPLDDDMEDVPPGGASLVEGQTDENGVPFSESQSTRPLTSRDGSDSDGDSEKEDGDDLDSGDESESDYEDVDEAEKWRRRMKKYKGRWYMMGLPSQAFKSEYYRSWRKWSSDNAQQQASPRPGSARSDREETPSSVVEKTQSPAETKQQRRLSTGTLGLMSSAEIMRKAAGEVLENALPAPVGSPKPTPAPATDGKAQPRRGRRGRRNSTVSQKGSSTARSASAGSAVDKEERMRRRQLILAARPGGTGMVTLPDGTKVRARRVDDADQDGDDGYSQEWGFAGLAKAQKLEAAEDTAQDDTEVEPEGGDEEEVRPPRTASPTGAEVLSDVTPRNASPSGQDREADSKLSLQERVRRRHEAEVAALGAEVLAAHRRKVGAAKESAAAAGTEAIPAPSAPAAGASEAATATHHPAEAKKEADKAQDRPGVPIRKDSAPPSKHTRQPLSNIFHRRPSRSTSPETAAAAMESSSRTPDSPDAHALRSEDQGRSRSKASNASSDHLRSSMDGRSLDYTTPMYSPMRSLPRKPDAKGYAVVPLPCQLGLRPERPREGRVWEWSDDESSLSSEAEEATSTAKGRDEKARRAVGDTGDQDEDETTNMDLNEQEMAEEEQRKAAHAKRATTTAAGLERMLVRTKSGATSTSLAATNARGLPAVQRTRTLDGESSSLANLDHISPARRVASTGLKSSPTQSRSASMSAQPSGAGASLPGAAKSSPSRLRKKASSPSGSPAQGTRLRVGESAAAQADSSSTEDDMMWSRSVPDALGMGLSLSPTTSRTSQTGSVRSSLQPTSPPLHAPTAFFGAKTSTEQQDRRRSMRKPSVEGARSKERSAKKQTERDDDAMDYGWPSSLKGSLYDR